MLLELNIRDFAIIERLRLQLGTGFNVLTGETGAGKSIIIDALGTLRGERTDPSFVRAGAERARIEGIFTIANRPDLQSMLEEYGLWDEGDEQVILSRELNAESGRSVARINGRAVNSSLLREIGSCLVDIHGQHEGLTLFNTRTHGDMLDKYGGLIPLREQVAHKVAELRRVREDLASLRTAAASRTERIEELTYLREDVNAARLRPGEEAELLQERLLMQNGARITDHVTNLYTLLYSGSEGGRNPSRAIVEMLGEVTDALGDLSKLDTSFARMAEQATELQFLAEELAAQVRNYRDSMDFDPARLDEIEDRLTLIRDMQRRYHATIEQILERAASAEAEIERLTHSDEHMADLEAEEQRLLNQLSELVFDLSQRRRGVGAELAAAVSGAMRDLAMPNVRFAVSFTHQTDPNGVMVDLTPLEANANPRQRYAFDKTGIDRIEFMLSPNPGEPLKPLAKIASGGESARLLLALKSILSKVDEVPTLVFDEVDVGVGGRAGQVVGEKLWAISDQHQVICITHLPQVAAFGDSHYAIAKSFTGERTQTQITQIDHEERVDELAAMLDGTPISEHSRMSAREMLERARSYKQQIQTTLSQTALTH
jgi:DNA repair protein RecN (Recombination protein N)